MSSDTQTNKKISKVLLVVFGVVTMLSVLATYYNTMVLWNFEIIDDLDEEMLEE